jgi:hypothetical protein
MQSPELNGMELKGRIHEAQFSINANHINYNIYCISNSEECLVTWQIWKIAP